MSALNSSRRQVPITPGCRRRYKCLTASASPAGGCAAKRHTCGAPQLGPRHGHAELTGSLPPFQASDAHPYDFPSPHALPAGAAKNPTQPQPGAATRHAARRDTSCSAHRNRLFALAEARQGSVAPAGERSRASGQPAACRRPQQGRYVQKFCPAAKQTCTARGRRRRPAGAAAAAHALDALTDCIIPLACTGTAPVASCALPKRRQHRPQPLLVAIWDVRCAM